MSTYQITFHPTLNSIERRTYRTEADNMDQALEQFNQRYKNYKILSLQRIVPAAKAINTVNNDMSDEFVDALLTVVCKLQMAGTSNETVLQLLQHALSGAGGEADV